MAKIICYGEETRRVLEHSVNQLADIVKITMGLKSRNVVLYKKFGVLLIANDGVTIVEEIELDDPFGSMGAQLMKEVSTKVNDVAGDGTTTMTLLAQAIIREGLKNLATGVNPMVMKRGIAKATTIAVEAIRVNSRKVSGSADIARMGTVSSSDETVGKLIAETVEKVFHNGVITVEESKTAKTYSEVIEGMQFNRGYIILYMVTGAEKMEVVLDDAPTLITDRKISNIQELLPILEQVVQSDKKLLVIAEGVEGEALSTLIINKLHDTLNVVCIKTPGFGDRHRGVLEDIAMLTGNTVTASDMGYEPKGATMDILSRAHQVKVSKENTIIVDGAGFADAIKARVNQIKSQIETTTSDYDREKLQKHLARMAGGMAIIRVGATTEVKMKEKKLHIGDALSAARAAVGEGAVAGGGTACVSAIASMKELLAGTEGDEKAGVSIIAKALTEPMRQIATGAGINGSAVLENMKKADRVGYGFDAYNETCVDMISAGIVNPTKVTRSALENAVSIAATLLITGSLVADRPQSPAPVAPAAPNMSDIY